MHLLLLLSLVAASPLEVAGLTIREPRGAALASPVLADLCSAPPSCEDQATGSRCQCSGTYGGAPVEVEVDFAGPSDTGVLALFAATGPSLAWARHLAGGDSSRAPSTPLRCPDLAGFELGSRDEGFLRVATRGGRGYVELREPGRLPAAWGQVLDVHAASPAPLSADPRALETDWVGLELDTRFNLPLASSSGSDVLANDAPPFDGFDLRGLYRTDHVLLGYGAGLGLETLLTPGAPQAARIDLLGEANYVFLSPARAVRPMIGASAELNLFHLSPVDKLWLVPSASPRVGLTFAGSESTLLRLSVGYTLAPLPSGGSVRLGGAFVELGVAYGLGNEVSAQQSSEEYDEVRTGARPARTARLLASMGPYWRPAGALMPATEIVEVAFPAGSYRLLMPPEVVLPGGGADQVDDFGDSLRVVDAAGVSYLFLKQAARVRLHFRIPCQATPHPVQVEELDLLRWRAEATVTR